MPKISYHQALFRNLCDYLTINDDLKKTISQKLLHYPLDNQHQDLITFHNQLIKDFGKTSSITFGNNKSFFDIVIEEADEITTSYQDEKHLNIQDKVILSIALRLLMEKKIIESFGLNNDEYKKIKKDQTRSLIRLFKTIFPKSNLSNNDTKFKITNLVDIVNIISANHIHLNSFMYEPLLDLHGGDLVKWYNELKAV